MRVGIVGGGQLARMMALSALPMGIDCSFLLNEHESDSCVKNLGTCVRFTPNIDFSYIYQQMEKPDVITIESEQVNFDWLEKLAKHCLIYPNIEAIKLLKNRISEKNILNELNIPTAKHFSFINFSELNEIANKLNYPFVIKSATEGYDGKNQYLIKNKDELKKLTLSNIDSGYIAESFINFKREISFIGVRSSKGEIKFYSATENTHKNSILIYSISPARNLDNDIKKISEIYLSKLMNHLNYVGVLAMECFEIENNNESSIIINELAPRVHNSGHWTRNGAATCQFENHIRAILGLSLGSTKNTSLAGMINILGNESFDLTQLSERSSLHWYKKQARANRKMGHINIVADNYESLLNDIETTTKLIYHN